ncbi:MAG: glutaminyl-peptide cyclotransferase [bacterium]|nr:glutaminyl-peptide cyclotransferase [bacterium]
MILAAMLILPAVARAMAPVNTCKVINTYPHDSEAFTQGLAFIDGQLFESTGRYDHSSVRLVNLADGTIKQIRLQEGSYFGEGIVVLDSRILQLTWRSRMGFIYDRDNFELLSTFSYSGEGWGIAFDGERLIMSDGTSTLRFLNASNGSQIGSILVRDGDDLVKGLNELEYIDGELWANVWPHSRIARIDPITGQVRSWVDCTGLLTVEEIKAGAKVLNGIAWDSAENRIFVTGKLWPRLFEIEVVSPK